MKEPQKRGIYIKVEKTFMHHPDLKDGKEKAVCILDIQALNYDQLPKEYTEGEHVRKRRGTSTCHLRYKNDSSPLSSTFLRVGQILTTKEFAEKMEIIKRCGERLAAINKKLREEKKQVKEQKVNQQKKEWTGEKEYRI